MMAKLCLMASHGYPPGPGLLLHQEGNRVLKDCEPYLPIHQARRDIARSNSLSFPAHRHGEPWASASKFGENNRFAGIDSTIKRPVLIDVQDANPDSILFSFGIAQQCAKYDKIMQFLMSGSNELERGTLDLTILSELTGMQSTVSDGHQQPCASLLYPSGDGLNPLVDFVGDMARSSQIKINPDGHVLFTGNKTEMDILSIVAEFYLSRNSTNLRKQSLVPQFNRLETIETQANVLKSSPKVKDVTTASLKSAEKTKFRTSQKNKNVRKAAKERDLYKRSYFHACESLLSIMMDKRHQRKTAIISLKKSGPELPSLLTKVSVGIAGTGLAVLFSVACKVACTRVPFCISKLLNTGVGFGLVWLSWAVNKLRDNIIHISKNATKLGLKDEEMIERVNMSMKEVYVRAATLMALAILKVA